MKGGWNRGHTKASHPSVLKISSTMRAKRIDNFAAWRTQMRAAGLIKNEYRPLKKNGDLAELMGVILGDGHICVFPRCECLRIVGSGNNPGFAQRYATIIEKAFGKKPSVILRTNSNAINITLYEKHIAKRLALPTGSRENFAFELPNWIRKRKSFRIRFLRGLYEAEGSLHFHAPTYTHKFLFSNVNESLLSLVEELVRGLGFHPHTSSRKVQISRKAEVQKLTDLLQFRRYEQ